MQRVFVGKVFLSLILGLLLLTFHLEAAIAYNPKGVSPYQIQTSAANPENFTIITLPDTQFYASNINGVGAKIFGNQTQWVANNAENLRTAFVTHEGDIVNDGGTLPQWKIAAESMRQLDAGNVQWEVLPGNHDSLSDTGLVNYNNYFGYANFSSRTYYGGAYPANTNNNNFALFSGGDDNYLIFNFQYHPSDAALAWANNTIGEYPNRRVIVTTHDYMNVDGSRTTEGNHIWNSFVAPHSDQVFLVLCGHNHGEAKRTDVANGHTVYQLLADYQSRTNGGNGLLRILQFSPAEDKIMVKTFSPYLKSYENDSDSEFTLDYEMTSSTQEAITINLQSPDDDITTIDNMPDFKFIATHPSQPTFSCSLWLQNTTFSNTYATKNNVLNESLTTITPSSPIPNGDWLWWINCTDGSTSNISDKRNITINTFRGDKTFTASYDGNLRYYWLDLPDNFDNSTTTPLVFFLHGYGGSRNSYSQKYPVLKQIFQNHTWIVAAIECRTKSGYQDWYIEQTRRDITDVLNILKRSYNINSNHIHVMGNSMGGGGALKYAMFNNEVIASLVDIHGITNFTQFYIETATYKASLRAAYGGTPSQVPTVYANESALGNEYRFIHTPVMMLHGTADDQVSVSQSQYLNQSLSALGYTVDYIEVPGVAHDAPLLIAGREMEIFNWFNCHPLWVTPHNLTVNVSGNGATNATGTVSYDEYTNVTVLATPGPGYRLDHWLLNGTDVGSTNPYTLNMTQSYQLTAVFTPVQVTLTVEVSGHGATNATGTASHNQYSNVTVQATPDSGYFLSRWLLNGSSIGSANPVTIKVTDNFNLTAVFASGLLIPLSGWNVDPRYTNAPNVLSSSTSSLFLELDAVDTNSKVAIRQLSAPQLKLSEYAYVKAVVTGTSNARILLRFFLDDGHSFDVVYWESPTTLDAVSFDLSPYAARTLTGLVYVAVMSSDGNPANIDITQITFEPEGPLSPLIPLSGWKEDPRYTNAPYVLTSTPSSLYLELDSVDPSSKVAIRQLSAPQLELSNYAYVNVTVAGTDNARILLRFFMDDGTSFDVVYWKDPATLNAASFDLSPYTGKMLTGLVYVALMSSDGALSSIDITQIIFEPPVPLSPLVPLSGWQADPRYTNAPYVLTSSPSSLSLELDAVDISSKVAIFNLNVPELKLSDYTYVDVAVSGTSNARILLRFFLDDGHSFDVVYWESPATLNSTLFNLSPYTGRILTGLVYVALMSSDEAAANINITHIAFET